MISKVICFFKGHKRGKRVGVVGLSSTTPLNHFQCPQCNATWTRKAKA